MEINIFSFFTTLIWVSIFSILIKHLSKRMHFLIIFSIYPLLLLVLLSLVRIFIPVELSYAITIRSKVILPILEYILKYPLIDLGNEIFNLSLLNILLYVWILVSIKKLYKGFLAYIRFRRFLFRFISSGENKYVNNVLHRVQKMIKFKKNVKIVLNENVKTPSILGFFSPIILLPNNIDFTEEELTVTLIHECAHYIYGHIKIKFILDILQMIFWWNPFLRQLNQATTQIFEMQADKKVSSLLGKKQQYIFFDSIIKVIENQDKSIPTNNNVMAVCYFINKCDNDDIEQRFNMFLKGVYSKKPKKIFSTLMFLFLLMLSYSFILQPYITPSVNHFNTLKITEDDYFEENDCGYILYDSDGEAITNIYFGELKEDISN